VAEPPVRFAGVLRGLRARAGLTQEELAGAAGLSPRQRALLGIVAYLLAALLALWLPVGGLLIIAVLPVFYGLTSEGLYWPWSRSRAAPWP
jgi:transcriptional regulator with XRE-family HTH domain